MNKFRALLVLFVLMLSLLTGCQSDGKTENAGAGSRASGTVGKNSAPEEFRAEDWVGITISIWTGTVYDKIAEETFDNPKLLYFNSPQEIIEAVRTGKTEATLLDEPIARKYAAKHQELKLLYPLVTLDEYGIVFGKEYSELRSAFNEFLKGIRADGTYDDMVSRWLDTADSPPMPVISLTGENGTLRFATTGVDDPFSFVQNGRLAGFDVEMAYRYAEYMGMDLKIETMDFGGMIPAVQSGKVHFAGDLFTITEERKKFIDFSDPHYLGGIAFIVREDAGSEGEADSFLQGLKKSFEQNLIVENRWRTLVKGLGVTIMISVFSFILATLLGFLVCFMRLSQSRLLRGIASVYITILRGTPLVVLLLITYYIIFASVNISSTLVAIIAFGFNGGAFISEIIRSAILTVDKGQIEAARSMGFSKIGAFFAVTFPQSVRIAFPVYKSEFISMVKQTAIVGYIAITDLTKTGDIIRSRTYDAFFPLIIVAIVYLIATGILIWLFERINVLTDKRQRRAKR